MLGLLESLLNALKPGTMVALFVGLISGVLGADYFLGTWDQQLYKSRFEMISDDNNELKARIEFLEADQTDNKLKYDALVSRLKKLQSLSDDRALFVAALQTSPIRPCDRQFLVHNILFEPSKENWDDYDLKYVQLSSTDYAKGYVDLYPGKPLIAVQRGIYTRILLESRGRECKIAFSLPKQE